MAGWQIGQWQWAKQSVARSTWSVVGPSVGRVRRSGSVARHPRKLKPETDATTHSDEEIDNALGSMKRRCLDLPGLWCKKTPKELKPKTDATTDSDDSRTTARGRVYAPPTVDDENRIYV